MNRRDTSTGDRQTGGYHSEDHDWSSSRQANQWQGDMGRQAGGGWESNDWQDNRYRSDEGSRDDSRDFGRRYRGGRSHGENRFRGEDRWSDREPRSRRPGYGARSDHEESRGGRNESYRFSGDRDTGSRYPARDYDASGGNDFSSFTSEDYGGRDFSSGRAGLSGGMRSSGSYRPSYGPGSWGGSNDYGGWREYGESRGFLERAGDEIASWFGNEDAQRRREEDHRGRGPSDYTRSDERIKEDVNDVLTHDWRLDASHIRVNVKDGEVTLEGTVDSRQAKRRAEDLSDDISGVRHVQNNLRVQATGTTATGSGSGWSSSTGSTGRSDYSAGQTSGTSSASSALGGAGSATGATTGTATGSGTSGSGGKTGG